MCRMQFSHLPAHQSVMYTVVLRRTTHSSRDHCRKKTLSADRYELSSRDTAIRAVALAQTFPTTQIRNSRKPSTHITCSGSATVHILACFGRLLCGVLGRRLLIFTKDILRLQFWDCALFQSSCHRTPTPQCVNNLR